MCFIEVLIPFNTTRQLQDFGQDIHDECNMAVRTSLDAGCVGNTKGSVTAYAKESSGRVIGHRKRTTCREAAGHGKETQGCVRNIWMDTKRGRLLPRLFLGI